MNVNPIRRYASYYLNKGRLIILKRQFALSRAKYILEKGVFIEAHTDIRLTQSSFLHLSKNVFLRAYGEIVVEGSLRIGENTFIGRGVMICSRKEIEIGKNCLIAEYVSIRDHDHAFGDTSASINSQGFIDDPVHIGNNVWIGAKVTIVKGVSIGDNSIIGSNAVVTHDIPCNVIAVGIPAKPIKSR